LIAVLVGCASADVFRIGFFADDFHFLDVARRIPLAKALLGQHGIYPWYRPLSRELYFWTVAAAGPASLLVAHLLSLACLLGIACLLFRLAERILEPRAAPVASALFVTYGFTKFLAAWPSGFQDLLATLLVLAALHQHIRGRRGLALGLAALAPFAKETGFLASPLILLYSWLCRTGRRFEAWMVGPVLVTIGSAALHWGARMTWKSAGTSARIELTLPELSSGLAQALGAFGSVPTTLGTPAAWFGAVAAVAVALLIRDRTQRDDGAVERPGTAPVQVFLVVAAALGLCPMVVGHLLELTRPHPYYAFPAVPWLALALGAALTRFPSLLLRPLVAGIVAINITSLGYRSPDLGAAAAWHFNRWDFPEAVRLSEVSRRLGDDVRRLLASRPDSLVVLYGALPEGCMFQTEDGPATRESLRDRTVRAFYLNDVNQVPPRLEPPRLVILGFDDRSFHLEHETPGTKECFDRAATSLLKGRFRTAHAWASYAPPPDRTRFELAYARAASILADEDARAFVVEMGRIGLSDSTGGRPAERAFAMLGRGDPGLTLAMEAMLRHPRSAAAHAALGDSFMARGIKVTAGMEWRIAVSLDPERSEDHYRLGTLLAELHEDAEARAELKRAAESARTAEDAELARAALAALPSSSSAGRREREAGPLPAEPR
jgi:hypothetical protein